MKSNENSDFSKLSRRQLLALPYILASPSYEEAARKAQISSKQIYEWLKDPEFKSELEKQRNQVVETAMNLLKMNTTRAAESLGELLSSPNELVKRGAANDILNHVAKFRELQELVDRVAMLEEKTKEML